MSDQTPIVPARVDILSAFNRYKREMKIRFAKQDAINTSHEELLTKMVAFMQQQAISNTQQASLNEAREQSIRKINDDLAEIKVSQRGDSLILQKLSRLWLAEDNDGPKPKSHAIGTWPGWKIAVSFFTVLGGLVLAYQIIIPILIAANSAILNATVHR